MIFADVYASENFLSGACLHITSDWKQTQWK